MGFHKSGLLVMPRSPNDGEHSLGDGLERSAKGIDVIVARCPLQRIGDQPALLTPEGPELG